MSPTEKTNLTRREFLKVSVLAGGASVLAACATPTAAPTPTKAPAAATAVPTAVPAKPTEKPVQIATATAQPTVAPSKYKEAPALAELVKAGKLPVVDQRLPKNPKVLPVFQSIGKYGGTWRRAYRGVSDRFGVHTTVCEHLLEMYQTEGGNLTLVPNVCESYKVNADGTEFTWNLREGIKWSDGVEVTSENAEWWYKNIYLDDNIAKGRLYDNVRQQQNLTSITANGKYSFVCKYSKPNGTLPLGVVRGEAWGLIGGLNFCVPSHYLSKYHKNTGDAKFIEETLAKFKLQTYNQLFLEGPIAMFALNPDLPVLGAWKTKVAAGAQQMVQERNPFFWQVDKEGNQLPYIDQITHDLFENQESFNLMLVGGKIDVQFRHVQVKDYTLLKENEAKGNYKVFLWNDDANGGYMINPTPRMDDGKIDEVQSKIVSRADFRRALSLAINRKEINNLLYNGLAVPRAAAPVPGSPVYKKEYEEKWAAYDVAQANKLLDGMGLTQKDKEGFRLRPDGKTLTLRLDVDNVPGSIDMDLHQLIKGYWEKVGVKVVVNAQERSLRETIVFSDRHSVTAGGIGNTSVPLSYDAWHHTIGGSWGRWIRNPNDPLALKPDEKDPEIVKAMQCFKIITEAYGMSDIDAAHKKLMEALDIYYDQCYAIGTVGALPVPGVVTNRMKNVPNRLIWGNALMRINMGQPPQFYIEG